MYCKNCGHELSEDAKFCQKCGNAVTPLSDNSSINSSKPEHTENKISGVTPNEQPKKTQKQRKENILKRYINRYLNRWKQCKQEKFKGRKNICWTAINAVILLIVIYNLAMCFYCNRDINGLIYYHIPGTEYALATNRCNPFIDADSNGNLRYSYEYSGDNILLEILSLYRRPLFGKRIKIKTQVRIGFKTYKVLQVGIEDGFFTFLSTPELFSCHLMNNEESKVSIDLNAMPKLYSIGIESNHTYAESIGGHANLYDLQLTSGESGRCLLEGNFPNLYQVRLKNVYPDTNIDIRQYPFTANNLKNVSITLSNSALSRGTHIDTNGTLVVNSSVLMYMMALPDSNIDLTHTLEDLYGTWIYRDSSGNEVFSITLQENGYVRINDGLGIIGVDLFTFSEIDNSTLLLKAETADSWGEVLSFNMPYELYGRELHLSIYGYELDLVNEDTANEYY